MAIKCEIISGVLPSLDEMALGLSTPECGAVSIFQGITRNNFNGKEVTYLAYECYEAMAIS